MKLRISADDFGLTETVTNDIAKAVDAGSINCASIMANGYAFDHAIKAFSTRPGLSAAVHVNLREGDPVAPAKDVALLLDSSGQLHHSFQALWMLYSTADTHKRKLLKEQVTLEIDAQITKVKKGLSTSGPVAINSHQHFHLIPFVFDALMELHEKHHFSYVRMASEPFFVSSDVSHAARTVLSLNLVKHVLLNHLSRRHKAYLRRRGVPHPEYFFGVLYSGFMNEATIKTALARVARHRSQGHCVELLVHPGRAAADEAGVWQGHADLGNYYRSVWRETERLSIMSPAVRSLLDDLTAMK